MSLLPELPEFGKMSWVVWLRSGVLFVGIRIAMFADWPYVCHTQEAPLLLVMDVSVSFPSAMCGSGVLKVGPTLTTEAAHTATNATCPLKKRQPDTNATPAVGPSRRLP
jgi:hypothetical protein